MIHGGLGFFSEETRTHRNINFQELQSYFVMGNRNERHYFLTNGDKFKFSYDDIEKTIVITHLECSGTYSTFTWT